MNIESSFFFSNKQKCENILDCNYFIVYYDKRYILNLKLNF